MFRYSQSTGRLTHPEVGLVAVGYAGYDDGDGVPEPGEGKNDPSKQAVKSVGPLPVGKYTIGPPEEGHGGFTLRLHPHAGNEMHGRAGFLIHGDSAKRPGSASLGCVIVSRLFRWAIWGSGDRELEVVP